MPRTLLLLTKNSPKVSSWSKNLLKFSFVNNTLLSINNTKIFQIRSRLQFLQRKGLLYEAQMNALWRPKFRSDIALDLLLLLLLTPDLVIKLIFM